MDAKPDLHRLANSVDQLVRILETLHPPIPRTPTDLYSIKQASRISGVRAETIYHWIERGIVPAYGRHQCYRVSLSELMPVIAPSRPGAPHPYGYARNRARAIRKANGNGIQNSTV